MARTSAASRPLTDHEEIRRWAEQRGAKPTCVRGTGGGEDVGMIRLDFPGFSGAGKLEEISWDEWFDKFDESGLALLVQDKTARGQKSNFNKLVSRETARASEGNGSGRRQSRSTGRTRSSGTAARRSSQSGRSRSERSTRTRTATASRGRTKRDSRSSAKKSSGRATGRTSRTSRGSNTRKRAA
jgi:hypothetical protein